jgi:hypothetical protein
MTLEIGSRIPDRGQVVRVRTRTYLVEGVLTSHVSGTTLIQLACLDDDAQGQPLEVVWELELDTEILDREAGSPSGNEVSTR